MLSINDVVTGAERQWRTMAITRRDRETMAQDLRHELEAAAADGATMQDLVSGDIPAFARDIATAAGATRVPHDTKAVLLAALIGACPWLIAAYILVWWLPTRGGIDSPGWPPSSDVFLIIEYTALALIVIVGALAGVWSRRKRLTAIGRTVAAMALLLPLAGLCTLLVLATVASQDLFSAVVVGAALSGIAIAAARRWAVASTLGTLGATPATRRLSSKIS